LHSAVAADEHSASVVIKTEPSGHTFVAAVPKTGNSVDRMQPVGCEDGAVEGSDDGRSLGAEEGFEDGADEGSEDGAVEGSDDGRSLGPNEGSKDGADEGFKDGADEGFKDGADEGSKDGPDEGSEDGADDGAGEGSLESTSPVSETIASVVMSVTFVIVANWPPEATRSRTNSGAATYSCMRS